MSYDMLPELPMEYLEQKLKVQLKLFKKPAV